MDYSTSTNSTSSTTSTSQYYYNVGQGFEDIVWNGINATRIKIVNWRAYAIGDGITITQGSVSETTTVLAYGSIIARRLQNTFTPGAFVEITDPIGYNMTAAGSDPVAWFGKESREFWLPVGELTPIISTPHLNMMASTFVGSPREQWIDQIVVTNADGFPFAKIAIKKGLNAFNLSKAVAANEFETIDLTLGLAKSPMKELPKDRPGQDKQYFKRMDVWLMTEKLNKVFKHLPWHVDQTHIGKARREAVIITSPDVRFLIISSPATEYYGPVSYLSIDYAHLDIHILDMKNRASVRGLLPELWGLKKMSNRTRELTCPPWSEDKCASQMEKQTEYLTI